MVFDETIHPDLLFVLWQFMYKARDERYPPNKLQDNSVCLLMFSHLASFVSKQLVTDERANRALIIVLWSRQYLRLRNACENRVLVKLTAQNWSRW